MPVADGATSAATALTVTPAKEQEEAKGDTKEAAQEVRDTTEEVKEDISLEDIKVTKEDGARITKEHGMQHERATRDIKEEVKEATEEPKDTKEEVKGGTRDGTSQEEAR